MFEAKSEGVKQSQGQAPAKMSTVEVKWNDWQKELSWTK